MERPVAGHPAVVIEQAGEQDYEVLAELRWRWRVDENGESGPSRSEFIESLCGWLGENSGSHQAFVVRLGGEIVGMAWLAVLASIPSPGAWQRGGGHVQSVFVLPDHRGNGLGTALMQAVIDHARDRGLNYLILHPSINAVALYERLGFTNRSGALELRLR